MVGGNKSCSESKNTEPVVARDREFTTDMAVDLPIMSRGVAATLKPSPGTTLQRVIENAVTGEAELRPAPESETGGWDSLLSWNVISLTFFVILLISLVGVVFVFFIAVNYIKKRCSNHHPQRHTQGGVSNFAARSDVALPLLKTQLTTDITEQQAGYENIRCYGVAGTEYQV